MKNKKLYHDCHTHLVLCDEDIPKYAFGWITPWLMKSNKRAEFTSKWLHRLIPFTRKDCLDRLAQLIKENRISSRERVKQHLSHFEYCNVLLVDLEGSMNAEKTKRSYEDQIIEAIKLKKEFNDRIKIYMMINPYRSNMIELVKKYYDDIDGYKYYPALTGKINEDYTLKTILTNYPKKNVIIHCTPTSPIYDRHSTKEIACEMWCNPIYTTILADSFKNINFILAHAGGKYWLHDCIKYAKNYKNIYLDISYTFEDEDLQKKLKGFMKIIPGKILFGTDWYMIDYQYFTKIDCIEELIENNKKVFEL